MNDLATRMKYWFDRVEQVLYDGRNELHVTPEEFNDLRQLSVDIEQDKVDREIDLIRQLPELMRMNPDFRYTPQAPPEPDNTLFNSYSGGVRVVVDWPDRD